VHPVSVQLCRSAISGRKVFLLSVLAILSGCDGNGPLTTGDHGVSNSFAGTKVTYLVATRPGGGYDTYARLIARYMEKHLGGADINIRNVPGAGNIVGANQLFVADPDGLTIGTFNTGLIYAQLLGRRGVAFDLNSMSWIGKAASDPRVLVLNSKSAIGTIDELRNHKGPILFGSPGQGSAAHTEAMIIGRLLGIDIRVVGGFGGNSAQLSMLRGEIDAVFGSYSTLRRFIENGSGMILLHVGGETVFGDTVPAAQTFATDDATRTLVSLIEITSKFGRLTAAPPGTKSGTLAVLRDAYASALNDPGLIADAKRLRIPLDPLFGEDVAMGIAQALDQSPANLRVLMSLLED